MAKSRALEEATNLQFGDQLRNSFATILLYCWPPDPLQFWQSWKLELCRDLLMRYNCNTISDNIENEVLLYLQERVEREGMDINKDFFLPAPKVQMLQEERQTWLLREEMDFDTNALARTVDLLYPTLNSILHRNMPSTLCLPSATTKEDFTVWMQVEGQERHISSMSLLMQNQRSTRLYLRQRYLGLRARCCTMGIRYIHVVKSLWTWTNIPRTKFRTMPPPLSSFDLPRCSSSMR